MTVYRCVPLFAENTGILVGIVQQNGTVEVREQETVVRLPQGIDAEYTGWQPTPSEAWDACADSLEEIAGRLDSQIRGCRTRATEEACS